MAIDTKSRRSEVVTASAINVVLGLWLAISPWIFSNMGAEEGNVSSMVVTGLIIAVLAASRAFANYHATWPSWVNLLFGLYVVAAPWIYGYAGDTSRMWNNVIVGLAVSGMALWSASSETRRTTREPPLTPA